MNRLAKLYFLSLLAVGMITMVTTAATTVSADTIGQFITDYENARTKQPKNTLPKNLTQNFDAVDKSLSKKIGQMIMVGFTGTSRKHTGVKAVMRQLKEGSIGGVMLMKHNIVSLRQVRNLTKALRQQAAAGGNPPPLISVDQEGGYVQRLRFRRYKSAQDIAKLPTEQAAAIYRNLACEVRKAGINVNFGPVADVDVRGRRNPVIGRLKRSYSKNPNTVTKFASQFVRAHKKHGVITAAKHFPGHGSSLKDSHKGFTAIPDWNEEKELRPFRNLVNAPANQRVEMVMVGHLYNKKWHAPATLSETAIAVYLRREVKFDGVVITDDMEMGAIRKNYGKNEAIIRAVQAGNDILLYANTVTHDPALGPKIGNTIMNAVCPKQGVCIIENTINDAYRRILKMKNNQSRLNNFDQSANCVLPGKKKLRQAKTRQKLKRQSNRRTSQRTKQATNFN